MADLHHQQQNTSPTIELREPATPTMEHSHFVSPSKWSLVPQNPRQTNAVGNPCPNAARGNWFVFWNKYRDSLGSISTVMKEPLIAPSVSDESLTYETPSPKRLLSIADQYGRCLEILHYGFNSTVRLHQRRDRINGNLFAIKVYRRNIWGIQNFPASHRPSFSAAAIAALHPHHPNILPITDLLFSKESRLCLVTPYCGGGNLHELLMSKQPLASAEIDCLMTQILRALSFIHERGMAHGDVRLEAVLLTENGAVKLAGLSDDYVHRIWAGCTAAPNELESESDTESEDDEEEEEARDDLDSSSYSLTSTWSFSSLLPIFNRPRLSPPRVKRHSGTFTPTASFPGIRMPYMAPEEFRCALHRWYHDALEPGPSLKAETSSAGDARPADMWAMGVIYFTLLTGRLPWLSARRAPQDPKYGAYLRCRPGVDSSCGDSDGYAPIEALGERRRRAVYALLDPTPEKRITAVGMLQSTWRDGVVVCDAGEHGL
ncbi:kinase-like domain-containing protein [Aspergillus pseudoustus]|uniref:Kinase-like domain-containing protein n=1 Tax=Aspergillus pseudoustus TaxID=1810923 RepID=A0ABR4L0K4_9EURO